MDSKATISAWWLRLGIAIERIKNLGVFASLILVAHVVGVSTSVTLVAAGTYFWARVAHYLIYGLGIPVLRTSAFVVGWSAQLAIAWQILGGAS